MARLQRSLALITIVALTLITALVAPGGTSGVAAATNPDIVRSWGKNEQGQLGDTTTTDRPYPVRAAVPAGATAIAAATAGNHSLALLPDGTVMAWGENQVGNLGNGTIGTFNATPGFVRDATCAPGTKLSGITFIASGGGHSLAIRGGDGAVFVWGDNSTAQLGKGDAGAPRPCPGQVLTIGMMGPTPLTGIVQVAGGGGFSLARTVDGRVYCWGINFAGPCGTGDQGNLKVYATQVLNETGAAGTALTNVRYIAAGGQHSLAVKNDGTLVAWGVNQNGQLGDGFGPGGSCCQNHLFPNPVTGVAGLRFVAVAGGDNHSLFLQDDGHVWVTGRNNEGQLGEGRATGNPHPVPQKVKNPAGTGELTGITAIAGGGSNSSLALASDGTVYGWGLNTNGQLGLGTPEGSAHVLPSPVSELRGAKAIAMGVAHALALAPRGTGLQYHALANPVRLLDTRAGFPACDHPDTPLAGNAARTEPARTACSGLPASAEVIVGNATVVNGGGVGGYVTLYPSGAPRPNASNLNYAAGQIVPNAFTVALGAGGAFNIFATSTTDFVVDITGYFSSQDDAGGFYFHPLPYPTRLLDTRPGQVAACDRPSSPLAAGGTRAEQARLDCNGITIPSGARAIVGNATVVNGGGASGYVTLYPSGVMRPPASNLNYVPGQIVPNAFTVALGADGKFNIFATSTIDFVVDITGYYSAEEVDVNGRGLVFTPLSNSVRLLDTRAGFPACDTPNTPLAGNVARTEPARIACTGVASILPNIVRAIVGNATVVNEPGGTGGFVTLYPSGTTQPTVSNLNYAPGQIVPNAFTVALGESGAFNIVATSTINFIVDITGYFAP